MKKQCTRRRKIFLWCLGVLGAAFAVAAIAVICSIPPYPAFYKDVNSLKEIQNSVEEELPGICVPEASWLAMTDGEYRLKMDGRHWDAKPEGYYITGTTQCNGMEISMSSSGNRQSDQKSPQDGLQYRDIVIEYTVSGERTEYTTISGERSGKGVTVELADATFKMGDYFYSLYTKFPMEGLSEEEVEAMRSAVKNQTLEVAYQMIDLFLSRIEG